MSFPKIKFEKQPENFGSRIAGEVYQQMGPFEWHEHDWNNDGDVYEEKVAKFGKLTDRNPHSPSFFTLTEWEFRDLKDTGCISYVKELAIEVGAKKTTSYEQAKTALDSQRIQEIEGQIARVNERIWWAKRDVEWAVCYCEEKIPYFEDKLSHLYDELYQLELIVYGGKAFMDAQKTLESIANDIVQAANDLVPFLYEGEERSNDWMDCGMADGKYETYLDILALLGVEYEPYEGYGRNNFSPIVASSPEEKLQKLIEQIAAWADSLEPCLEGEEDRPNDLMDCGEIDGAYELCVELLEKLGVENTSDKDLNHSFDDGVSEEQHQNDVPCPSPAEQTAAPCAPGTKRPLTEMIAAASEKASEINGNNGRDGHGGPGGR